MAKKEKKNKNNIKEENIEISFIVENKEKNNMKTSSKRKSKKHKKKNNVYEITNQKSINRKKIKVLLEIILCILIFCGIVFFVMITPLFYVKEIEVNGNDKISKERIISLSRINYDVNTFKYNSKDIINKIKEEPYIESVHLKRILPNKIAISVTERKPNYILRYAGSYVYINNQGYILEISNEGINLPIIEGVETLNENLIPGNRLDSNDLQKLNIVIKISDSLLNNEIYDKLTEIDISDKNNYILKMEKEGKKVYLGNASNINDRILMLKEILKKEENNKGEIFIQDMNKIYFRQEN